MMTLNEQKLAIAGKLPELIEIYLPHKLEIGMGRESETLFYWKQKRPSCPSGEVNWPTDGLQICHEAEKLLTRQEQHEYYENVLKSLTGYGGRSIHHQNTKLIVSATYEQRLEALCRVWWAEKWKE